MKNFKTLFFGLLFTGIIFSGCNKIEEATEVTFEAKFEADLNVVVPPASRNVSFETADTIDPASDPEVEKYLDKIKKFEVQTLIAEVTSISKNVTLVTADLSVFNTNHSAVWHMENLPLTLGATIPLGNEDGQWNTVNQIFDEKTEFTVKLEGETDEGDVTFTVKVTFVTKVTAKTL
jgi:hypothetical protein